MANEIKNPRAEIDAIDRELLRLLNRRGEIALRIGAAKVNSDASLCDPRREQDVIGRVRDENPGPFDEVAIANIFQRVIDETLYLQQRTLHRRPVSRDTEDPITAFDGMSRVAFLGERGTFSEEAALGIFGEECQTVSFPTFEELFRAIDEGKSDFIISPLENSLVGSIHRCYDLLLKSSLNIAAEIVLPVAHYLVACPEATLETIRTVESHPAALAQCERFLAAYPHLRGVAAEDTAGSVRRAVESGDVTRAAVGGRRAAAIYRGKVLREHIEDHSENFTRFALLSSKANSAGTGSKISLVLRLKHQPGALHSAMRPFVRRGIDLLKIESRPIKDAPSQFYFYLDLRAPASESELDGALAEVSEQSEEVRYLGRYSTISVSADP